MDALLTGDLRRRDSVVKVRDGQVRNTPYYVMMGVTTSGERDILGIWAGDGGEGARFRLQVGNAASGMWLAYTPEVPYPAELQSARLLCAGICDRRPAIEGQLPRRDVAHMAVTALGYLTWGIEEGSSKYGLGDLGGWPLDLLQIWGAYRNAAQSVGLPSWLHSHLGIVNDGRRFGYDNVLADAEAWLIAHHMKTLTS